MFTCSPFAPRSPLPSHTLLRDTPPDLQACHAYPPHTLMPSGPFILTLSGCPSQHGSQHPSLFARPLPFATTHKLQALPPLPSPSPHTSLPRAPPRPLPNLQAPSTHFPIHPG